MALVVGATGDAGKAVARQLIEAGHTPRLVVRNVDKARACAGKADIVRGDLTRITRNDQRR